MLVAGADDHGEPVVAELAGVLEQAGYTVDTSSTIPDDLDPYEQVWWVELRPFAADAVDRLVDHVAGGGGLYLTGERPGFEALNQRTSQVVNELVAGGGVQVGGLGDVFFARGPLPTNPDAVGQLTTNPFEVTSVVVDAPGGLAGVDGANVVAYVDDSGVPIAAAWDADELAPAAGRLMVMMDFSYLRPGTKGATTDQFVQNVARFLSGRPAPPTDPGGSAATSATRRFADHIRNPRRFGQLPGHVGLTGQVSRLTAHSAVSLDHPSATTA